MFSRSMIIFTIVTGIVTTVAAVVSTVDQIMNGDKRAGIAGDAAGKAVAGKLMGTEDTNVVKAKKA
jgi:hypothetical protein